MNWLRNLKLRFEKWKYRKVNPNWPEANLEGFTTINFKPPNGMFCKCDCHNGAYNGCSNC